MHSSSADNNAMSQDGALDLHRAITLDAENFKSLVQQASVDAINQALILQNNHGWPALQKVARYQPAENFKILVQKASPDALNQALIIQDKHGCTAFDYVGRWQSAENFKMLLEKASPEAIKQALVLQYEGWSGFETAARNLNAENFKILLEVASSDAINQALVIQDNKGYTAFRVAAQNENADNFKALLEKASGYAVSTAILKNNGLEGFNQEIRKMVLSKFPSAFLLLQDPSSINRHPQDFIALHKKIFHDLKSQDMTLSDCQLWIDYLNKALKHAPDADTRNAIEATYLRLNWIASYKTSDKREKRLFKIQVEIHLNNITSPHGLSAEENYLVFDLLSRKQETKDDMAFTFKKLQYLHRAVIDTHNKDRGKTNHLFPHLLAIVLNILNINEDKFSGDENSWTEENEKLYKEAIGHFKKDLSWDDIFILQDNDEWMSFDTVVCTLNAENFKSSIEKVSLEEIDQGLVLQNKDGWTGLEKAARYKDPKSFKILIEKASPDAINQALILQDNNGRTAFETAVEHQSEESFRVLLGKASPYAISTAILKNKRLDDFKKFDTLIQDRVRFSFLFLKDPSSIKKYPQDFIVLHKKIFHDLNENSITLADCKLWFYYLNKSLEYAPDENTRNVIESTCMRLSWIASSKTNNEFEKDSFNFRAIKHCNNVSFPSDLTIDDNILAFKLSYAYQKENININQLKFLHQAVDKLSSESKDTQEKRKDIYALLSNTVSKALKLDLINDNKDEWTNEDEEKYQKAIKYFEIGEHFFLIEMLKIHYEGSIIPSLDKNEKDSANELKISIRKYLQFKDSITADTSEDILNKLAIAQEECLKNADNLLSIIKNNIKRKEAISFIKNLTIAIATAPFLVGFVYAGAWLYQYKNTNEHLFFNEEVRKAHKEKSDLTKVKQHLEKDPVRKKGPP